MALFRKIYTEFWRDDKVLEILTPEDKLFFVYILTNQNTTQTGIYKITRKEIAFDLGYSIESINSLMDRFISHYKIIKYNESTKEIAIKNWGKYNLNSGGKPIIDCIKKELKSVKDKSLIKYVSNSIEKSVIKDVFDSYINQNNDTYNDTSTIRGQEKEEEKEKDKEKDKEKEKDKDKEQEEQYCVGRYATLYQENIGVINGIVTEWLLEVSQNIDIDLFKKAIEIATYRGKCSQGYVAGIIRQWENNNIHTYEQLKAYEVSMKNKGEQNNGNSKYQRETEEDESLNEKPTEEQLNETRMLLEKLQMRKMQR